MRVHRERNVELYPDDIAWVTEWQLAACFRWLPIDPESSPVEAGADPEGRVWPVRIRAGGERVEARLPVRDLMRLVRWCHRAPNWVALQHPPATIRPSLLAVRSALRAALSSLDPLQRMGYAADVLEH